MLKYWRKWHSKNRSCGDKTELWNKILRIESRTEGTGGRLDLRRKEMEVTGTGIRTERIRNSETRLYKTPASSERWTEIHDVPRISENVGVENRVTDRITVTSRSQLLCRTGRLQVINKVIDLGEKILVEYVSIRRHQVFQGSVEFSV